MRPGEEGELGASRGGSGGRWGRKTREFLRLATARPRFRDLALPAWVRISPAVQVAAEVRACPGLDAGESEALSLALEMQASAVLVDEAAARNAAKALKVVPIGIAGILLRAKD